MKKLSRCEICSLPLILLKMPTRSKVLKFSFKNWKEAQGPTTHKSVRKWCSGTCHGIIIPLWLEVDALAALEGETKNPKIKKLAGLMKKRLIVLCKGQEKKLAELMKRL